MSVRGPRLEFAVGAFLLLALASLLVLALASTNGKFTFGAHTYPLKARFTNLGQLRTSAPVKVGGVVIGIDGGTFWQVLKDAVDFRHDFLVALEKSAVFGGTAALVASYVGYHAEPTVEGTSVATTRAVVNASLLVLMFNFVLSAFLFGK